MIVTELGLGMMLGAILVLIGVGLINIILDELEEWK